MQSAKLNEVLQNYFKGGRGCQIKSILSIIRKQYCENFCNIFTRQQIKNFASGGKVSFSLQEMSIMIAKLKQRGKLKILLMGAMLNKSFSFK